MGKVSGPFQWLSVLILMTLLSEGLAKTVVYFHLFSNNVIYHFFTPLEYGLYVIIFSKIFESKRVIRLLYASWAVLVLAEIFNTTYFQPFDHTNTNIMILESVLLVFFSLLLFLKIKDSLKYDNLLTEGVFWLNSAILVYYSFNILVWGFHSFKIYNMDNPPVIIYKVNLLFSAFLYLVMGYAIQLDYLNNTSKNMTAHG
jgi:hypothetical protein